MTACMATLALELPDELVTVTPVTVMLPVE